MRQLLQFIKIEYVLEEGGVWAKAPEGACIRFVAVGAGEFATIVFPNGEIIYPAIVRMPNNATYDNLNENDGVFPWEIRKE